MMPRTDRRWILVIAGGLAVVLALRLGVEDPSRLGLSLPAVVPVIVAAYCFGVRGALVTAAVATAIFAGTADELDGPELAIATSMRALVFFGSGLLVAELLRREAQQAALITAQRGELGELRVLREALTPAGVADAPGLAVASAHVAADGQVGGDFFLVVPGEDGRAVLAVGDAVGHGVVPARRAAYVRAVLATLAATSHDPARLLELANTALLETAPRGVDFITAVCASIDGERLSWASAGHPPPWDLDSGDPLAGSPPRPPLGVRRDMRYVLTERRLAPGDGVLLFSDGLPEARSVAAGRPRPLLGEAAVRDQLRALRGEHPAAVVRALTDSARAFAGGALADDLCLLAVRRT